MAAKQQPTVRMNRAAKDKLDRIQALTDLSQPDLLDRAIELLERDVLSRQLEADLTFVAENADELRKYRAITDIFDNAASDGLDADE